MVFSDQLISALQPKLRDFSGSVVDLFVKELRSVMRDVAAPEIKNLLMSVYDDLAETEESEMGEAIRGKDPLSLKRLRSLFERQVSAELESKITVTSEGLEIGLLDEGMLGYGGTNAGEPEAVDVLNFYIEGVVGEFGFITPQQYKARGRRSSKPLGRVGGGFLIPRDRYEAERWSEVTGVSFSQVRHAISNQPPFRGFHDAIKQINFKSYVEQAVQRIVSSLEGTTI